jgi:hypothetical protein
LDSELAKAMSYRGNELQPGLNAKYDEILANRFDYGTFDVVAGYGHVNSDPNNPYNMRGSSGNKDIYMITTIRATYILGKTFHRAKFR